MALVRSDPFRDVDRLLQQFWTAQQSGSRSMAMPMDAYRKDDSFLLRLDLPGVEPDSVELTVRRTSSRSRLSDRHSLRQRVSSPSSLNGPTGRSAVR